MFVVRVGNVAFVVVALRCRGFKIPCIRDVVVVDVSVHRRSNGGIFQVRDSQQELPFAAMFMRLAAYPSLNGLAFFIFAIPTKFEIIVDYDVHLVSPHVSVQVECICVLVGSVVIFFVGDGNWLPWLV